MKSFLRSILALWLLAGCVLLYHYLFGPDDASAKDPKGTFWGPVTIAWVATGVLTVPRILTYTPRRSQP